MDEQRQTSINRLYKTDEQPQRNRDPWKRLHCPCNNRKKTRRKHANSRRSI